MASQAENMKKDDPTQHFWIYELFSKQIPMKTGHVRDSRSLMQCLDRLTENKSAIRSDAIQEVILLARNASFHNSDLEEYEETALSGLLTCIRKSPDIPTTISAFRAISLIAINSTSSMLLSFQDLLGLAPSMYRTTALTVTASFVEALTTCLVFSTEDVFDFYEPMLTFCANILSRRMTSESKKVFFPTTTKNPLSPSCTPNILIDECDTDGDMDGNVPEEQSEATTSSSEIETKREKKPPRRGKRKAKALQTHPSQQSTEHPKITHPDVHEISQTPHLSNTPRSHTPKSSLSQYNTNSDTSFDIFRHQSESPSGTATSRKHTPPLPSPSPVYQITLSNTTTVIKLSRQNENSARSHLVTRTFDALSFFFSVLGFRFPQSHHFLEFAGRYLVDPSPDVRIAASNLIAIFETIGERENENPNHIDDDAVINWAKAALSALSQESVHQKSKKDRSEQRKAMRSVLRFLEDGNEPTQTFRFGSYHFELSGWPMLSRMNWLVSIIGPGMDLSVARNTNVQDCFGIDRPLKADAIVRQRGGGRVKVDKHSALGKSRFTVRDRERRKKGEKKDSWLEHD